MFSQVSVILFESGGGGITLSRSPYSGGGVGMGWEVQVTLSGGGGLVNPSRLYPLPFSPPPYPPLG